jgi:acetyltransferase-like isoleucine patch superfamily enzyme
MLSVVVADEIVLGPGATIDPFTMVYYPKRLVMGERARIAGFVRIIGKTGEVVLGPQSYVGVGCLIDTTSGFELGARSELGPRGLYYTHGAPALLFNVRFPQRFAPIRIGQDSWVAMGCVVNPGVEVGDRVIVFPGLTLRSNVPDDTSLLPREREQRTAPTRLITMQVRSEDRSEKIEVALRRCAEKHRRSHLNESRDDLWILELPGRGTVYLVRGKGSELPGLPLGAEARAIWTLSRRDGPGDVPQFCFDELCVRGPWTPFAEHLAVELDRNDGVRFAFVANTSRD